MRTPGQTRSTRCKSLRYSAVKNDIHVSLRGHMRPDDAMDEVRGVLNRLVKVAPKN